MKRLVFFALAATIVLGQQAGPTPLGPNETIRVVEVKNTNANSIRVNLEKIFPGITESNGRLIIRGQAPVVDMIEDAVKKLDVPPAELRPGPSVEITAYLVYASAQEGAAGVVPADLESTVRQLRTLFPYRNYRVMDTILLRGREGKQMSHEGILPGTQGGKVSFSIYQGVRIVLGQPRTVAMQEVTLSVANTMIRTSVDAKEGQKTVVGKANVANTEDAIFLVIAPKIIE